VLLFFLILLILILAAARPFVSEVPVVSGPGRGRSEQVRQDG
jgi:hypothetical protein